MEIRKPNLLKGLVLSSALAFCSSSVFAADVTETDATQTENNTFATAETGGVGTSEGANLGNIGDGATNIGSNDVDMWQFNLLQGQNFSADLTFGDTFSFNGDAILMLFWENGGNYYPVAAGDHLADDYNLAFTPWATGTYYLAVMSVGNDAQDTYGNPLWNPLYFTTESVTGTAFSSFSDNGFSGFNYSLAVGLPAPAVLWLMGAGLAALGFASRRKA